MKRGSTGLMIVAAMVGAWTLGGCAGTKKAGQVPGFYVKETDEKVFVVKSGTPAVVSLRDTGTIKKPVTIIGARVNDKKVYGPDAETVTAYAAALKAQGQ